MKTEMQKWREYINCYISPRKDRGALEIFQLWLAMVEEFGDDFPLPAMYMSHEGPIQWSWSRSDRYFEITVEPDGMIEWFLGRDDYPPEGTPEDPEPMIPTDHVIDILRTVFNAPLKGNL